MAKKRNAMPAPMPMMPDRHDDVQGMRAMMRTGEMGDSMGARSVGAQKAARVISPTRDLSARSVKIRHL